VLLSQKGRVRQSVDNVIRAGVHFGGRCRDVGSKTLRLRICTFARTYEWKSERGGRDQRNVLPGSTKGMPERQKAQGSKWPNPLSKNRGMQDDRAQLVGRDEIAKAPVPGP
jgi:hypothetical protein